MFEFCFPTKAASVPDRPNWLHEVKYDGYRLRPEREGKSRVPGALDPHAGKL